ncbi:MAG TPA: FAD-dependent oxidoreductase [Lacunisphaera sp.]|nr:FAD-dependent oxidoreductase [Lacunisphaera sp.]
MHAPPAPTGQAKYAWSEIDRREPPLRPVADRLADFREVAGDYDEATAREQARRCIQCPHPTCVAACPLHCAIPELLALTADGQFGEAAELFFSTHYFPELASHACVGGRVCERDCVLAGKSDAVPIRAITRFLLHYGWKHGLAEPALAPPKSGQVAVLGSGICGLVAADALTRRGYAVTVFDSRRTPGGRMMNGLPGFRMDREMVAQRVALLQRRGIQFHMGVAFGPEVKLSALRREFDAVFLSFGHADAVPLEIPGAELRGVYPAAVFLAENAGVGCGGMDGHMTPGNLRGQRVVVLGAGDTAMDVLRTAIRLGAADALCLCRREEKAMLADAEEYARAREEGARFLFSTQASAVLGDVDGRVFGVRCVRTETLAPEGGRRPAVRAVPQSETDLPADAVFVAYGFQAPQLPHSDDFARLALDPRGRVEVTTEHMTNLPGVFAGGAILRGTATMVELVLDARQAADGIDQYLTAKAVK